MTGQPEGQGKGVQRRGGNPKRESKVDNRDRSVLRKIMIVRKAIHWVFLTIIIILRTIIILGELANSGQPHNLMSTTILRWESTTTAGILMAILVESGATPPIQMRNGIIALSQHVDQQC